MQLNLSDEQLLLHETTVRFIESELPLSKTRALHEDSLGFERSWLRRAADLGWFAMLVPEADGGGNVSGAGLLDAAIIAEAIGRFVQPGPFVPMNVVAGTLAAHGAPTQRAEILPQLVAGELIASWAFADEAGDWDCGRALRAEPSGNDIVLTGTRGYVQDAGSSDMLLVVATLDDAPAEILVPTTTAGITLRPLECLDLSRRMAHVDFDAVTVPADAVLAGVDASTLEGQLRVAIVLTCAETIGATDELFAMTVAYSKDRIAFGRPIGSFQALKHVLADQALFLETAKSGAVAAARAVQSRDVAAGEIVSIAAAYIGDVANDLAQECLQIHGGIGYTWEHDLHLLMRRIRSNSALYGEPTWHRERVCAAHDAAAAGIAR